MPSILPQSRFSTAADEVPEASTMMAENVTPTPSRDNAVRSFIVGRLSLLDDSCGVRISHGGRQLPLRRRARTTRLARRAKRPSQFPAASLSGLEPQAV